MPSRFDPQIPFDGAQGKHHRHSIRLKGFDYSRAGAYFVTIVTRQRECLFGEIANGEMKLNNYGSIVAKTWKWLEDQYSYIELLHGVVMPNHFHGLLMIHENGRGGSRSAPTVAKRKPLGQLVGAFKTVSTKQINLLRHAEGTVVWQRNYGARPEPVEGNTSFAMTTKCKTSGNILNRIRSRGRTMTKTH